MDQAKVRSGGTYLFGGASMQFIRLPVPGDRLAITPQAVVVGVLHGWMAGGVPSAEVIVQPVPASAPAISASPDHVDPT